MTTPKQITIDGESKTIREWSAISNVPHTLISGRLSRGWDPKRAVYELPGTPKKSARKGARRSPWRHSRL